MEQYRKNAIFRLTECEFSSGERIDIPSVVNNELEKCLVNGVWVMSYTTITKWLVSRKTCRI